MELSRERQPSYSPMAVPCPACGRTSATDPERAVSILEQRDALAEVLRTLLALAATDDWCDGGAVIDALDDARDALSECDALTPTRSDG